MNQTWQNDKKPNVGPYFGPFGPNLVPQRCFTGFTFTCSWTLFEAIILCNLKES